MFKIQKKMIMAILALSLMLGGCGSNDDTPTSGTGTTTPEVNGTTPPVTPPVTPPASGGDVAASGISSLRYFGNTIQITENSQTIPITINAFDVNNAPISNGTITIFYPVENIENDLGTFTPSKQASIVEGKASFTLVGPSSIQKAVNSGLSSVVYKFYDDTNSTVFIDVPVSYSYTPSTIIPKNDTTDYSISFTPTKLPANLEDVFPFTIALKSSNGSEVAISSVDITSKNVNLAQLILTTDTTKTALAKISNLAPIAGKKYVEALIETYKISGLTEFEVSVTFINTNGDTQIEQELVSIIVNSGEPTAMSITYEGGTHDEANAEFVDHLVVHLADKYGNPVNTRPNITFASVVSPTYDATNPSGSIEDPMPSSVGYGDFNRLYNLNGVGAITADPSGTGAIFTTTHSVPGSLANVDPSNDILITFSPTDEKHKFVALGKWEIESVTGETMKLKETFVADVNLTMDKLRYVVGHNFRSTPCNGQILVSRVDNQASVLVVNEFGNAHIELRYDYKLVGADIFLAANVIGKHLSSDSEARIGTGYKSVLKGIGIKEIETIEVTGTPNSYGKFSIGVNIIGTGSNMEYGYAYVRGTGNGNSYMSNNFDAAVTGCNQSVDFNVTIVTDDPAKAGTVTTTVVNLFSSELN